MNDYRIDRNRWAELNIFEQMGNIGSEVGRAIKARRNGNEERLEKAIARALDLFAATTELLVKEKSPRLSEVLRARNEFLRLFYDGTFDDDSESIERYFTQFAVAARKHCC
jgi:hypothetical protein